MSTITVTEDSLAARRLVSGFAEFMDTPVGVRESLADALRDALPEGMDNEQVGWTLTAVSTALLTLARVALSQAGDPADIVSPRMLGALCSTAEGFITESQLPSLDDDYADEHNGCGCSLDSYYDD